MQCPVADDTARRQPLSSRSAETLRDEIGRSLDEIARAPVAIVVDDLASSQMRLPSLHAARKTEGKTFGMLHIAEIPHTETMFGLVATVGACLVEEILLQ